MEYQCDQSASTHVPLNFERSFLQPPWRVRCLSLRDHDELQRLIRAKALEPQGSGR